MTQKTVDEIEQEVIEELNLEYSGAENPNKMWAVQFPYELSFTLDGDNRETKVTITTTSEEFYSARNEQDVKFQKDQSDQYSQNAFTKHIIKFVENELWSVDPADVEFTYTGEPLIEEMSAERLEVFERELVDG